MNTYLVSEVLVRFSIISNTSKALESSGGIYIRNARKSKFEWVGSINYAINCQSAVKGGGLILISWDSSTTKFIWKNGTLAQNTEGSLSNERDPFFSYAKIFVMMIFYCLINFVKKLSFIEETFKI